MAKYTVTFVKESGYKDYYQSIVEADDEQQAFVKVGKEAELKGLFIPDEVWITRIHKHKTHDNKL